MPKFIGCAILALVVAAPAHATWPTNTSENTYTSANWEVKRVEFQNVPLVDALMRLIDTTRIPVTVMVDVQAMQAAQVDFDQRVTVMESETAVHEIVNALLNALDLGLVRTAAQWTITSRARAEQFADGNFEPGIELQYLEKLAEKLVLQRRYTVRFEDTSLEQFVLQMMQRTGIGFSLDAANLWAAGIAKTTPITVCAQDATLEHILTRALAPVGLTAEVSEVIFRRMYVPDGIPLQVKIKVTDSKQTTAELGRVYLGNVGVYPPSKGTLTWQDARWKPEHRWHGWRTGYGQGWYSGGEDSRQPQAPSPPTRDK